MFNRTSLHGRLTANPELKFTPSGTAVTQFSVAVEDSRIVNGERKVNFFKCEAWTKTAEFICKYFTKGQQIIVDGRLDTNTYTDRNGIKRKDVFVVVEEVDFSGAKSSAAHEQDIDNDFGFENEPIPIE